MEAMLSTQAVKQFPLPLKQYIHGKWVDSTTTEFLTLRSSLNDSIITEKLPCATTSDVDAAVDSAEQGLKLWQAMTLENRRSILWKFADLLEANAERLAYLEAVLVGKPVSLCMGLEVPTAAEAFRYYAGFVDKIEGELSVSEDGYLRGVLHQPLGICAAIIPFNSPIITFAMKVAPALASGNSIIVKVSEFNPFSALCLGELGTEAGLPAGVLNIIAGAIEAGQALSSHMKIRKISFTGSPVVGRKIQVAAAQSNLKRVTLELGGKSPVLVFDDADIGLAVQSSMSFLAFNGQGCVLGTRIYVQKGIAQEFIATLKAYVEASAAALGADPFAKTTLTSPMFHHRQKETVLKFLEQGRQEATLLTGGSAWGDKGCFIQPTIFCDPSEGADIVKKEIFGPVAVITTFETEEEALGKANDTEYGLGAYVFTKNMDRAIRLAKALEAGSVAVNCANPTHMTLPFGGWKSSGIGAENGKYVLRAYTQPKAVNIRFASMGK